MAGLFRRDTPWIVVFSMAALSACSAALKPPVVEEGKAFPVSKCSELNAGATAAQVQSALGVPLHVERDGDVETWEYFVRVLEADARKFLGFVPMPDAKTRWSARATVKLDRGVVVELACPR
jgi:outer membrane protein assembly factor BamE (lipoprotein component of BamABCDE complex)